MIIVHKLHFTIKRIQLIPIKWLVVLAIHEENRFVDLATNLNNRPTCKYLPQKQQNPGNKILK